MRKSHAARSTLSGSIPTLACQNVVAARDQAGCNLTLAPEFLNCLLSNLPWRIHEREAEQQLAKTY